MKAFLVTLLLIGACCAQQSGKSTRYWDCCKPSCSWPGKGPFTNGPVRTCKADGTTVLDANTRSGCDSGGTAFVCNSQVPWAVNSTHAYGFAAAKLSGLEEKDWCCSCYQLTFTNTAVAGQKFIVQVTNTGSDLGANHFDLQIPGGGVGYFNGCQPQWNAPVDGWGARYGGVTSRSGCDSLPSQIRAGCYFRFDWFKNADNPEFTFVKVNCPTAITDKTGCIRSY